MYDDLEIIEESEDWNGIEQKPVSVTSSRAAHRIVIIDSESSDSDQHSLSSSDESISEPSEVEGPSKQRKRPRRNQVEQTYQSTDEEWEEVKSGSEKHSSEEFSLDDSDSSTRNRGRKRKALSNIPERIPGVRSSARLNKIPGEYALDDDKPRSPHHADDNSSEEASENQSGEEEDFYPERLLTADDRERINSEIERLTGYLKENLDMFEVLHCLAQWKEVLGIPEFDPIRFCNILAESIANPNHQQRKLLNNVHVQLAKAIGCKSANEQNWFELSLKLLKRQDAAKMLPKGGNLPLWVKNSTAIYGDLSLNDKVTLLVLLCRSFLQSEKYRKIVVDAKMDSETEELLRPLPVGYDRHGNGYWLLGESSEKLFIEYSQLPNSPTKSSQSKSKRKNTQGTQAKEQDTQCPPIPLLPTKKWDLKCGIVEEYKEFIATLSTHNKDEKQMAEYIESTLIPRIELRVRRDYLSERRKRMQSLDASNIITDYSSRPRRARREINYCYDSDGDF